MHLGSLDKEYEDIRSIIILLIFWNSAVAEHCWYTRESDCWPQLRQARDRPSYISLSTSIRGTVGDR